MEIKKVGVLGCGLMGSGIAQVCAMAGFDVTVLEVEQKFLDKGFAGIEKSLAKFAERPVEKGGITAEQKDAIRARLKGTTNKADLADCDIVIEAIIENVEEKKKMYASLDGIVKKDAIFASNTSSISVTELLTATKRPERFIGLHFFNPVPLMKLVEVVRTIATADDVYESAYAFAKKLGKVPVRTSDKTGFIVNRLLVPYLLDAIRAYEEGVGSIEDIDKAMKLGCGYPMGPFTLLDFVGLDTTYYITHVMYDEFKERRFASPPLLKRMVMAGWYGRKSGRGFMITRTRKRPPGAEALATDYARIAEALEWLNAKTYDTFENILLEKKNSIAYVTVNRPKVLNALNMATMEELRAAFHDIKTMRQFGSVIFTGSGEKAFIAGADISELAKHDAVSGKGIHAPGAVRSGPD